VIADNAVDSRLVSIREEKRKLMAPLASSAPAGSKEAAFVKTLDYFMSDYAESLYEAGYDESKFREIIGNLLKNVAANMKSPVLFDPLHRAVRGEPFDYYRWAQSFMDTLILWDESLLEGEESLQKIDALVQKGDNVILLANHQTEGDPQVVTLMLERLGLHALAQKLVFVAGHRVTTDPIAIPFSLGCNLLCIYSKKYIEAPPELKAMKQQRNMDTMGALQSLLMEGGQCVWVAPSGGRDRRPAGGGEFEVTPFDAKSVELFRLMAVKAAAAVKKGDVSRGGASVLGPVAAPKTHVFTLAMLTRKLVPPPEATTDRDVGEVRTAKRGSVHLKFGPELAEETAQALFEATKLAPSLMGEPPMSKAEEKAAQRGAFTALAQAQVQRHYLDLVELELDGKVEKALEDENFVNL